MSSAIDHLTITCEDQENKELLQEIQSLKLKNLSTPLPSQGRHAPLSRKASGPGIGSPKSHKHGLKASLFSLFERKNSPEEGKSSFYVDINQKQTEEDIANSTQSENVSESHVMQNNQSDTVSEGQVTQNSQSEVLVDLGLDPSSSGKVLKDASAAAGKSGTLEIFFLSKKLILE